MHAAMLVFLVWSAPGGGAPAHTTWLDARGRELADRAGITLAEDGALWDLVSIAYAAPLPSCADLEDNGASTDHTPGAAHEDELVLVARADPSRRVHLAGGPIATPAPGDDDGAHGRERTHWLAGAVGPWLFVDGATTWRGCDVRDATRAEQTIVDARTGAAVAALSAAEAAALAPAGFAAYVETLPVWRGARLRARHRFIADEPSDRADDAWGDFTRSDVVEVAPPRALARLARAVPAPVARWLARHPDARGVTWGPRALVPAG